MTRRPSSSVVVLVVAALGVVAVETGLRAPDDGAVAVPTPVIAGGAVERLRAVPLLDISDPRAAAVASGVVFGRTEHVTSGDEQAFLSSGLWHLLR